MNEFVFFLQLTVVIVGVLFCFIQLGQEGVVCFCLLLSILANFFVLKQIELLGWNVTCSDSFAVGNILGLNLLQHKYGSAIAQKTILISFFGMLFFTFVSQLHLFYKPSSYDTTHHHFEALLKYTPRLLSSSIVSFFITQQFNLKLFAFFKKTNFPSCLGIKKFSWKNLIILSLLISQFFDTLLFTFFALYGVSQHLSSILIVSYMAKFFTILITAFLIRLVPLSVDEA